MNNKIDLIRQALGAAESSIKLARQLLSEVERGRVDQKKELPGVSGMFDGESMATTDGHKFPVPENYASKSMLVVGDTLKLVEENGAKRFKQIEHVKRHKTTGILAKKDGKWKVVTPEGSYKVLPVSVDHFNGKVGDEVLLQLPANNLTSPFGAIEKVMKKGESQVSVTSTEEKVEEKEVAKESTKAAAVEKAKVEDKKEENGATKAASAKVEKKEEKKEEVKIVEEKKPAEVVVAKMEPVVKEEKVETPKKEAEVVVPVKTEAVKEIPSAAVNEDELR